MLIGKVFLHRQSCAFFFSGYNHFCHWQASPSLELKRSVSIVNNRLLCFTDMFNMVTKAGNHTLPCCTSEVSVTKRSLRVVSVTFVFSGADQCRQPVKQKRGISIANNLFMFTPYDGVFRLFL